MLNFIFILLFFYFFDDLHNHWNDASDNGSYRRRAATIYIVLMLFAWFAINGWLSFYPYDHHQFWQEFRHKQGG